jgi:O-antigen/teichoic acid export membrane protein
MIDRNKKALKSIAALVIFKGVSIIVNLLLVPLTINYLNPTKYGIWITLSSIISWFGFFDIGLGNGLRNKLTEAFAERNNNLAQRYVSTTYFVLSIISAIILLFYLCFFHYLNWNIILNVDLSFISNYELNRLALILFSFFCIQLVLKLVSTILIADQRPAISSLLDMLSQIGALLAVFILTKFTEGSLLYLGVVLSGFPIIILLFASMIFFCGKYKNIRPSFKNIDFSQTNVLFSLGLKFFIIQIAAILLYQTNNIIISQLFGPESVTSYNIVFKYFSVVTMVFTIVITPFWSAFTEAWYKGEVDWIKSIVKKLLLFWFLIGLMGLIMLFFSETVYSYWVGKDVNISLSMSALVFIWIIINVWNTIFSHFLNGVGKVKLQFYLSISIALLNLPLAIIAGKYIGIEGVLIVNIFLSLIAMFIYPLQYKKVINKVSKGIWDE